MNKDAEGNEYTFKTPQTNDWGTVTGVLVPLKDGSVTCKDIDPESGDLKFTMHDINISQIPDRIKTEIIVAWIKETVAYHEVVPMDESNSEALIYNLVHLAQDGDDYEEGSYGPYNYEPHQDAEIKSWNI